MTMIESDLTTRRALADLLTDVSGEIVTQWSRELKMASLSSYADRPLDELEADCRQCLDGYIAVIADGDHTKIRRFIQREVRARVAQGFRASELARRFSLVEPVAWPLVTDYFTADPRQLAEALALLRAAVNQAVVEFSDMYQLAAQEQVEVYMAEMEAMNRRLEELSVRDPLTGLYNRRYFQDRLTHEFQRARRHTRPLSLLMVDVDHFKIINDTYGHSVGDQVLRGVALLLVNQTRSTDITGRYGGEEFVALLPETDAAGALRVAEKVREAIAITPMHRLEEVPEGEPVAVHCTVSIGVALLEPETMHETLALINASDLAMYAAKTGGRNRVVAAWHVSDSPLSPPVGDSDGAANTVGLRQ